MLSTGSLGCLGTERGKRGKSMEPIIQNLRTFRGMDLGFSVFFEGLQGRSEVQGFTWEGPWDVGYS